MKWLIEWSTVANNETVNDWLIMRTLKGGASGPRIDEHGFSDLTNGQRHLVDVREIQVYPDRGCNLSRTLRCSSGRPRSSIPSQSLEEFRWLNRLDRGLFVNWVNLDRSVSA